MSDTGFLPERNFAGLSSPYSDRETAKVVVLPVPYDGTTSWRGGAREGPRAIIDASRYLEMYDQELDREIYRIGIHTRPEVEPDLSGPEAMVERVAGAAGDLIKEDKMPVMLGGDHSLTLGMVKAMKDKFSDLSVLHLDAHADLRDTLLGTKFSHGSVMRRVLELCPVVPVGIRSLSLGEHDFIKERGLKPFYAETLDLDDETLGQITGSLSQSVYISIDVDVLDPALMPATGTPEPGGLGWYEVLRLLRAVSEARRVVGADIVELCPDEGPVACSFLVAKLAYKLMGYAFSKGGPEASV